MKKLILVLVLLSVTHTVNAESSKRFVGGMCSMAVIVSKVEGGTEALRKAYKTMADAAGVDYAKFVNRFMDACKETEK
tara:strand:+ start:421 stop:654 length:234 start_codon:yes stop_codon:yes gene_type:complete